MFWHQENMIKIHIIIYTGKYHIIIGYCKKKNSIILLTSRCNGQYIILQQQLNSIRNITAVSETNIYTIFFVIIYTSLSQTIFYKIKIKFFNHLLKKCISYAIYLVNMHVIDFETYCIRGTHATIITELRYLSDDNLTLPLHFGEKITWNM